MVKNLPVPLSKALIPNLLQGHRATMVAPVKQPISLHLSGVCDNISLFKVISICHVTYQQDLERLRESMRTVEKQKEHLNTQMKLKQNKTVTNPGSFNFKAQQVGMWCGR